VAKVFYSPLYPDYPLKDNCQNRLRQIDFLVGHIPEGYLRREYPWENIIAVVFVASQTEVIVYLVGVLSILIRLRMRRVFVSKRCRLFRIHLALTKTNLIPYSA